jgi:Flp pilus assembly pilin Flp
MCELLKRLWQEEEAQDVAEYALLMMMVSLATVAAVHSLVATNNEMFLRALHAFVKPLLVGA